MSGLDLTSRVQIADPYPGYERTRRSTPLFWNESLRSWVFTDYESVKFVLEDPRFSATRVNSLFARFTEDQQRSLMELRQEFSNWIMMRDNPSHQRMRHELVNSLARIRASRSEQQIAKLAEDLFDQTLPKQSFELVEDLAYPFPLMVVADLIGLPRELHSWLREKSRALSLSFGIGRSTVPLLEMAEGGQAAARELKLRLREMTEHKRKNPGDDLLSHLLATTRSDSHFEELLSNLNFFILAGHETTTYLLGSGVYQIATNPQLFQRLAEDHSKIPAFVEEVLRFESPVQLTSRVASEMISYRGCTIRAEERVFAIIGSANRDEKVFNQPNVFDIDRASSARNLAFGSGAHACLGAQLAKLEARIFFERLLTRVSAITVDPQSLVWSSNFSFRGLESARVTVQLPPSLRGGR